MGTSRRRRPVVMILAVVAVVVVVALVLGLTPVRRAWFEAGVRHTYEQELVSARERSAAMMTASRTSMKTNLSLTPHWQQEYVQCWMGPATSGFVTSWEEGCTLAWVDLYRVEDFEAVGRQLAALPDSDPGLARSYGEWTGLYLNEHNHCQLVRRTEIGEGVNVQLTDDPASCLSPNRWDTGTQVRYEIYTGELDLPTGNWVAVSAEIHLLSEKVPCTKPGWGCSTPVSRTLVVP